ncbi:MAG: hypothetical protein M3179_04790 [Actinomycetota bacterium]|nr:hypothetical protein [Actinomycetota bacterium]
MATRRTTFSKTQRERDKREKAAAKRERRASLAAEAAEPTPQEDPDTIIAQLAALHLRYEEGTIALDEFAARQEELRSKLSI